MKKFAITLVLVAFSSFMKANTIENDTCLQAARESVENSEEFRSNCWLVVDFIDEDGSTVQVKEYEWEASSLEDCFGKIGVKVKEYEANEAITVKAFRSQYL